MKVTDEMPKQDVIYQASLNNGSLSSAWIDVDEQTFNDMQFYNGCGETREYNLRKLYTYPQTQCKPLSEDEIKDLVDSLFYDGYYDFYIPIIKAVEQLHGIGV